MNGASIIWDWSVYIFDSDMPKKPVKHKHFMYMCSRQNDTIYTYMLNKFDSKSKFIPAHILWSLIVFMAEIETTPLNNLISTHKSIDRMVHLMSSKCSFYTCPCTIVLSFSMTSFKEIPMMFNICFSMNDPNGDRWPPTYSTSTKQLSVVVVS